MVTLGGDGALLGLVLGRGLIRPRGPVTVLHRWRQTLRGKARHPRDTVFFCRVGLVRPTCSLVARIALLGRHLSSLLWLFLLQQRHARLG